MMTGATAGAGVPPLKMAAAPITVLAIGVPRPVARSYPRPVGLAKVEPAVMSWKAPP